MTSFLHWLAISLIAVGLGFVALGAIGILRFRDVYLRLHASSKSLTFGFGFLMVGVGLLAGDPASMLKAITAVAFQFLTAPLAAMILARAALKRGVDPLTPEEHKSTPPPAKPAPIAEAATAAQ